MVMAGAPTLRNLAGDDEPRIKAMMDACAKTPTRDFGLIARDYFAELPTFPNPNARK